MATIRKRKLKTQISFQVQVRRVGSALITKSFLTKEDAIKWARKTERELDQGAFQDYQESDKVTLGNLFERYIAEGKHKKKRQWRYEEYRKNQLLEDELAKVSLLKLSTKHLAYFMDRRLKEVRQQLVKVAVGFHKCTPFQNALDASFGDLCETKLLTSA